MTQATGLEGTTHQVEPTDEELRFVRSLHDVFVSIGLLLFVVGIDVAAWVLAIGPGDRPGAVSRSPWALGTAFFGAGVVAWLLSEYFSRRQRLALPSIVLCGAFSINFAVAVFFLFSALGLVPEDASTRLYFGILFLATGVSAGLFYARFKVPFSIGFAGYCLAVALRLLVLVGVPDAPWNVVHLPFFVSGVGLFVAGVCFDAKDPERRTRFSDNGFWLHLFAAPMVVYGTLGLVLGGNTVSGLNQSSASVVLTVVLGMAFVSLMINRRALIVSGLLSAGLALGGLMANAGIEGAALGASVLLALGMVVIIIGVAWHRLRRIVLAPFPKRGTLARIFPPEPSARR